jgi:radical SAM-linked protein
MRFASHRDVARAIERGVRKAGVPVAYSAGFSPHPRISYSGGAPTGTASEAEYLEISLTRRCEAADLGRRLDAALPDGIDVVEVVEVDGKSAALELEASVWEVSWPGVAPDAAARAVQAFLSSSSVPVERLTGKGLRRFDARAAVVSMDVLRRAGTEPAAGCAILRMIVRQMTPAVRPDDILAALCQSSAVEPAAPAMVTRLWQGPLSGAAEVETGMSLATEATGTGAAQAAPPVSPGPTQAARPQPARQQPASEVGQAAHTELTGPETRPGNRPEHMTDNAMWLLAGSAESAPAGQARANQQLPRGARGQSDDTRAREPYGRDCPDARNRATESTVRAQ